MRIWTIIGATLALATGVTAVAVTAVAEEPERDAIRILRIEPEEAVERGVETTFTIDVEARLESTDEGMALVGFNSDSPTRFHMVGSRSLKPGFQRFTFKVKVVPVDWGERGYFTALVNMGPRDEGAHWIPTAWDQQVIEVAP